MHTDATSKKEGKNKWPYEMALLFKERELSQDEETHFDVWMKVFVHVQAGSEAPEGLGVAKTYNSLAKSIRLKFQRIHLYKHKIVMHKKHVYINTHDIRTSRRKKTEGKWNTYMPDGMSSSQQSGWVVPQQKKYFTSYEAFWHTRTHRRCFCWATGYWIEGVIGRICTLNTYW